MVNFVKTLVKSHFKYGVSRSSANLAYFLLFSFFPLLIFLNSVLGLMNIELEVVYNFLAFLPDDVIKIIGDYLVYLSSSDNLVPLFLGLGLTLYSFSRFVNSLFYIINDIYEVEKPRKSMIISFFFTFALMASVYAMLILVVAGGFILTLINSFIKIPVDVAKIINVLRYLLSVSYFFFVILLLYKFIPKVKLTYKQVIPGTIYAILGIFIISIGFSFYVNYFSNYSLIYGSLSTIMILMFWLYMSGMVIIQGSIINKIISKPRKKF